MNSEELTNKAREFLSEYANVISLQVFERSSVEYRLYLEKIIHKRNALLEVELSEKSYRQIQAMEEQIRIMLGFFAVVDTTLKLLSKTAYEHLNFDAQEWAKYKFIEQENTMWTIFFTQKLKFKRNEER